LGNWISDFAKAFADYFSTREGLTVLVAVMLTTIITIILEHAIPALGRFIRRFLKLIWKSPSMIRAWYRERNYWKHFGIKHSITGGTLSIEKVGNRYSMSLPISLQYQNRDTFKDMWLYLDKMSIRLRSPKLNRAEHYDLGYESGLKMINVKHNRVDHSDYVLSKDISYKPILGDSALCSHIYLGEVSLNNIKRRLEAKPFLVRVDWSKLID
jgi:hypothetical protein